MCTCRHYSTGRRTQLHPGPAPLAESRFSAPGLGKSHVPVGSGFLQHITYCSLGGPLIEFVEFDETRKQVFQKVTELVKETPAPPRSNNAALAHFSVKLLGREGEG